MPPAVGLERHEDSLLSLKQTATDRRFEMPFRKTFAYDDDYIDVQHRSFGGRLDPTGMIDIGVEGWLLPADAYKLYEMAYFCPSDILELGSYRGLSATVMNQACNSSGRDTIIVSVDLDPAAVETARAALRGQPGGARAHFFVDDAGVAVRNLASARREFGFSFVDHSHRYEHVFDVCQQLHRVVGLDGFALFHDFNDPRNALDLKGDYGVYQGALDGLRADRWEFWGIYGCSGLFRRIGLC